MTTKSWREKSDPRPGLMSGRPGVAVGGGRSLEHGQGRDHRGLSCSLPGPGVRVPWSPPPSHRPARAPRPCAGSGCPPSSSRRPRPRPSARRRPPQDPGRPRRPRPRPLGPTCPACPARQWPSALAPLPLQPLSPGDYSPSTPESTPHPSGCSKCVSRASAGPAGIPAKNPARADFLPLRLLHASPHLLRQPWFWKRPFWRPLSLEGHLAIWSDQGAWVWCVYICPQLVRHRSLERQDPHPTSTLGVQLFLPDCPELQALRLHKAAWVCSHPAPWPQRGQWGHRSRHNKQAGC